MVENYGTWFVDDIITIQFDKTSRLRKNVMNNHCVVILHCLKKIDFRILTVWVLSEDSMESCMKLKSGKKNIDFE